MTIEAIYSAEELDIIMEGLIDDDDRIDYLWEYLSEQPNSDHEIIAVVYETLGKLYVRLERSRADVFQKAGEHWESEWVDMISKKESNRDQRFALKNALKNYKIAGVIYGQTNASSLTYTVKRKMQDVRSQLKAYGTTIRSFIVTGSSMSFMLAMIFLTNTITGFIAADIITTGPSLGLGIFLFFISIAGFFFVAGWR